MLVPMVTPQWPHHLLNSLSNPKGGSSEPGYDHAQCVVFMIMLEEERIGFGLAIYCLFALAANPAQEYIYKTDNKKN